MSPLRRLFLGLLACAVLTLVLSLVYNPYVILGSNSFICFIATVLAVLGMFSQYKHHQTIYRLNSFCLALLGFALLYYQLVAFRPF